MRLGVLFLAVCAGIGAGVFATFLFAGPQDMIRRQEDRNRELAASSGNDRFQDYVMATGPVSINPRVMTDGVWLLDYRAGKLLGTVIDRSQGKITGWAEVDLVTEFNIPPKQDVHFMMTTGTITQGQSALYVAEVSTGKFAVYTMGAAGDSGIIIRRHDMTTFRPKKPEAGAAPMVAPVVGP